MRSKILLRAAVLALAVPLALAALGPGLLAQDEDNHPSFLTSMGIEGGVTLTNVRQTGFTDEFTARPRFVGGVFITFQFGQAFALQPELLYVQKGSYFRPSPSEPRGNFRIEYLEVPVLFKFLLPIETSLKPNIFAGPFAAYRIRTARTAQGGITIDAPQVRRWDYGATIGAGIDLVSLGTGARLTLNGRYDMSLYNVWNDTTDNTLKIRNRTWIFMLGLGF